MPQNEGGRLLKIIEDIAAHGCRPNHYPGQKELNRIYRLCHAFNNPKCLKNHPKWADELKTEIRRLGGGV